MYISVVYMNMEKIRIRVKELKKDEYWINYDGKIAFIRFRIPVLKTLKNIDEKHKSDYIFVEFNIPKSSEDNLIRNGYEIIYEIKSGYIHKRFYRYFIF